jgi:hypothetical protein
MEYLDWKKENAEDYYRGLIDQSNNSPISPINPSQRPSLMSADELSTIIEKRGLVCLARLIRDTVDERYNEIELYDKCQRMIKEHNKKILHKK